MQHTNLKICYDISVLGWGSKYEQARTGIFRVTENVLLEIIEKNQDIKVILDCQRNKKTISHCYNYINNKNSHNVAIENFIYTEPLKITNFLDNIECSLKKRQKSKPIDCAIGFKKKIESILLNTLFLSREKKILSQIDIYHSSFYPIPEAARRNRNNKIFLTVYDLIPFIFPQYFEESMQSFFKPIIDSIQKSDWILSISESTKNDLCELRRDIDPARVIVTPLAADPNIFYPCNSIEITDTIRNLYKIPEGPYILSVNTLEPRKNIEQVISSFIKLCEEERLDDISLVLVGTKGWKYEGIFDLLQRNGNIRNRIVVTGYVPDEDLAALYSGALVFVYPSFYEGFGLPPLEAMQCGVPVITSNTSSLPEVVGDAGILVNPKDTDSICQGILNLYKDGNLRNQMARTSLQTAKKFTWERCVQKTISAYKMALSS